MHAVLGVDDEGALAGGGVLVGSVLVDACRTKALFGPRELGDGGGGRVLLQMRLDDEVRGLVVVVAGARPRQRRQQVEAQLVVGLRVGDLAEALGRLRSGRVRRAVAQRPGVKVRVR